MRAATLLPLLLILGACGGAPRARGHDPLDALLVDLPPLAPSPEPSCAFGEATRCAELCDGGDAVSCNNLGAMSEIGRALPRDRGRALVLYEHACLAGAAAACVNHARLVQEEAAAIPPPPPPPAPPPPRAEVDLDDAKARCNSGDAASCWQLPGVHIGGNVEIHGNVKIFGDVYFYGR